MTRLSKETHLLLRMPSWLGDFVMAEPTLRACAKAVEEQQLASLSLAGPPRFFELLEGRFDDVRRLEEDESWRGHDAAVFLDGSLRSVWRATRAGIRTRWSWFSGGRALLATGGFAPARELGRTPTHLGKRGDGGRALPRPFGASCAELLGVAGLPVIEHAPLLAPSAEAAMCARTSLARLGFVKGEPYLVLDASARPGSAKAAPPELWAAVLAALHAAEAPRVVLLTAPGEERLAQQLAKLAPVGYAALPAAPPGLAELLALVRGAEVFLGPDSGPRHIAHATRTRAVVLFGPSDPRHTTDHTSGSALLSAEVPCGPCHREVCVASHGDLACFRALSAEQITAAALGALERAGTTT